MSLSSVQSSLVTQGVADTENQSTQTLFAYRSRVAQATAHKVEYKMFLRLAYAICIGFIEKSSSGHSIPKVHLYLCYCPQCTVHACATLFLWPSHKTCATRCTLCTVFLSVSYGPVLFCPPTLAARSLMLVKSIFNTGSQLAIVISASSPGKGTNYLFHH
jgi:hypothetical protein